MSSAGRPATDDTWQTDPDQRHACVQGTSGRAILKLELMQICSLRPCKSRTSANAGPLSAHRFHQLPVGADHQRVLGWASPSDAPHTAVPSRDGRRRGPAHREMAESGRPEGPAAPPRHSAAAHTPRLRPVDVHRRISRGAAAAERTAVRMVRELGRATCRREPSGVPSFTLPTPASLPTCSASVPMHCWHRCRRRSDRWPSRSSWAR